MSKRMQVLVEQTEYKIFQRTAGRKGMSLAEWVRQTLRLAARREPVGSVERKLAALRKATQYRFPAPDIDQMLAEIEQGYLDDPSMK